MSVKIKDFILKAIKEYHNDSDVYHADQYFITQYENKLIQILKVKLEKLAQDNRKIYEQEQEVIFSAV